MATTEHIGLQTYVDSNGDKKILYPITKVDAVDGLDDALDGKANSSHTHAKSQITDFPSSLPASDVYSWAKQPTKPTYTASEVGARANTWTPTKSDIGLGNVDNTSDSNKSVKYATSAGSVTGSNKVVVSSTAPTDTSAVWIV